MRILGIDPGFARSGWGIVDFENGKIKAIGYGCIETSSSDALSDRLFLFFLLLKKSSMSISLMFLLLKNFFSTLMLKLHFMLGRHGEYVLLPGLKRGCLIICTRRFKSKAH